MVSLRRLAWTLPLLCAFVFACIAQPVMAEGYGRSTYGSCLYGKPCGNTVVVTPKGLEIAINLKDGQVIPRAGYTITITPLNGTGDSFASAEIYIDSVLRGTTKPGQNGTASWFWDVVKYPGTRVRVVVFDTDGGKITRDFTVVMETDGQGGVAPTPDGTTADPDGIDTPTGSGTTGGQVPGSYVKPAGPIEKLQELVRRLPESVVFVFPWLLFLLLLVEIVLLLWQTKREVKELRTLQELTERERNISSLKTTLMQLVSHYLRTPFTILKSGAEGIEKYNIAPEIAQRIQQTIAGLGASIEGLIAQVHDQAVQQAAPAIVFGKRYSRQHVFVWIPVVCIALVTTLFVWLAFSVDRLSGGLITVLIYASALAVLVISIWLISSRFYLKKRDTEGARAILSEATAMQVSRDDFIRSAATVLAGYVQTLRECSPYIPTEAPLAKFVLEGIDQLDAVQNKFAIAMQLQGSKSGAPYQAVPLKQLYDQAVAMVGETAQAKQIKLSLSNDADMIIQNEKLMVIVLRSLLDNAVAYSPEGSEVSVSGQPGPGKLSTISVLDHGKGIEKDKLDMLFQPFSKVEGAETFTHEGMGFSLYLDKLIMAYLGGSVDISSEPQRKTEARLTIPKA